MNTLTNDDWPRKQFCEVITIFETAMGMFDTVYVPVEKLPLAEGELIKHRHEFQTKGLECLLDAYEITNDGNLIRYLCEPIGKNTPPEILVNFSDSFNFYSDINGKWFEFTATFKDGKLVSIERDKEQEAYYTRLGQIAKQPTSNTPLY